MTNNSENNRAVKQNRHRKKYVSNNNCLELGGERIVCRILETVKRSDSFLTSRDVVD